MVLDPMEALNLWPHLMELIEHNRSNLVEYKQKGIERANAEKAYRDRLAKAELEYRAEGQAVTLISDICRGRDDISTLKVKWDCAEVEFDAIRQDMFMTQKEIDVINDQINREWSLGGNNVA